MAARAVSCLHFNWPTDRGHWRLVQLLSKSPWLERHLRNVPFRSSCGVPIDLDIASDRFLFLSGRLAPEPLEIALASRMVREGDLFVDIGAHWGLYILHMLGRLGRDGAYYAIEPSTDSIRFLRRAFSRVDARLRFFEVAISEFDGDGHLVAQGSVNDHLSANEPGTVPVRVARLDSMLAGTGLHCGCVFVKADTEGHEAAVIKGCRGLAEAGVRPIFLLEFLPERFGQTRADILNALDATFGKGYTYWAVAASTGCLVRFERADEPGTDVHNFFAIPEEGLDRLSNCPHTPSVQ